MDPEAAVGYALIRGLDGEVRRHIIFSDMQMVPEDSIEPVVLEYICQHIPFLDTERRASHLPTALLMQLRTCLEKQEDEIAIVHRELEAENTRLRTVVLSRALERDPTDGTEQAIVAENAEMRRSLRAERFRDRLDKAEVAALKACLLRMTGAIWSFAPVGQQLSQHNDPHVRRCYETNLSLLTMMQETCESALKNCEDLIATSR